MNKGDIYYSWIDCDISNIYVRLSSDKFKLICAYNSYIVLKKIRGKKYLLATYTLNTPCIINKYSYKDGFPYTDWECDDIFYEYWHEIKNSSIKIVSETNELKKLLKLMGLPFNKKTVKNHTHCFPYNNCKHKKTISLKKYGWNGEYVTL
jgi:hypothetical protein